MMLWEVAFEFVSPVAAGGGRRRRGSLRHPCSWSAASGRPGRPTRRRLPAEERRSSAHSSGRPVAASCTLGGLAGKHTHTQGCKYLKWHLVTQVIIRDTLIGSYLTSWWGACTVLPVAGQNLSTLVDQGVSHRLGGVAEDAAESWKAQKHTTKE